MQIIPQARNLQKYEEHQFSFGGINHSAGAKDGAIYDMENMSLDEAPTLSVRKKRQKMPYDIEGKVYGIGSADKLFWCCDSLADVPTFYYDGEAKFPVSATEKTFAVINKYICIFPDKMYFSLWQDETKGQYESLEALNEAKGKSLDTNDGDVFAVGTKEPYSYFQYNSQGKWVPGTTTGDHAVQTRWIYLMDSWGSLDDSVTINYDAASTASPFLLGEEDGKYYLAVMSGYNDKLMWVRTGDTIKLRVGTDDNLDLTDDGYITHYAVVESKEKRPGHKDDKDYYFFYLNKDVKENGYKSIIIERYLPDLSFAFCHDNRLWGVEKDKIYASKLGDPFNFNDYSLIASSAWTVGVASSGEFTGGIAYNGYPTFFKEDSIIRVLGDYPSQYSTYETANVPGVAKGSGKSLAIANGYLYYLSPEGVCAYSGSYPTVIGENIGEVLSSGVAGAGSDKYFLEAINENNDLSVYVYDTRRRAWAKEEKLDAVSFTDIGRDLYALTEGGIYLLDSDKASGDAEADFDSFVEFAPIYDGHLTKKGLSKLHISLEVAEGANVAISISYDNGEWIKVKDISSTERQTFNIPLTIRRCGTYRIKFEGKGHYIIYAIGKVRYFGSDM